MNVVAAISAEAPAERVLTQPALADLSRIPAQSRWVRAGELHLHVLDYGPADGVPVLIVPGITSPAVTMDFVARELVDLVRPLVLDVRGRGLSDSAPAAATGALHGYDLDAYADDIEAVVATLGLDRPVLFGHSMGARIAATSAARQSVALRGTVLVEPPMSGPGRGDYPTTLAAFLNQLDQARRGTDTDEVAASWPRWPRAEQALRARWLASCSRTAIAATHAGFETEDFFDGWPQVPAPTVLIYGADSPVVTTAGAVEAATARPGSTMMKVRNAGHMVFWDEPTAGLAAARKALANLL